MALDDVSGKLDSEKFPSLLLHLLMANVAEQRAMKSLFIHYLADGKKDVQLKLIKELDERLKLEHDRLRDKIFEIYGKLPPELLGVL